MCVYIVRVRFVCKCTSIYLARMLCVCHLLKRTILQLIMELFLELLFESGSMHPHGQGRTLDEPQLIIRPE